MENYNIDELVNEMDFGKNMHKKINNMLLTEHQIDVLKRFDIDYDKCSNMNELLYYIDECLGEMDNEELELVASEISEINYYMNTNK